MGRPKTLIQKNDELILVALSLICDSEVLQSAMSKISYENKSARALEISTRVKRGYKRGYKINLFKNRQAFISSTGDD